MRSRARRGCGAICAKYTLFFFNFLVWLAGVTLMAIGIWVMVDPNATKYLLIAVDTNESFGWNASIVMVSAGSALFLVGFLGCCGALRESPCMLMMYIILVIILLLTQVAAGVLAVIYRSRIIDGLEMAMNKTVQVKYGNIHHVSETEMWDLMQIDMKCCGATVGPTEWRTSFWFKNVSIAQAVPDSCCVLVNGGDVPLSRTECYEGVDQPEKPNRAQYLHTEPCYDSLESWVNSHTLILIGIAFGFLVVQIAGVIMGCCLHSEIRNKGITS